MAKRVGYDVYNATGERIQSGYVTSDGNIRLEQPVAFDYVNTNNGTTFHFRETVAFRIELREGK
jgi:hypothetical protein